MWWWLSIDGWRRCRPSWFDGWWWDTYCVECEDARRFYKGD